MQGGEASRQVLQDSRAPFSRQGPLGTAFPSRCRVCRALNSGVPLLATYGTAALRPRSGAQTQEKGTGWAPHCCSLLWPQTEPTGAPGTQLGQS